MQDDIPDYLSQFEPNDMDYVNFNMLHFNQESVIEDEEVE